MEYEPLPDEPGRPAEPERTPDELGRPSPERPKRRSKRRILVWIVVPLLTVLLAAFGGVVFGASIKRPEVETLDEFVPLLTTVLYDRSGDPLRTYAREHRILLDENDVPERLEQAILAAEDDRFYEHGGVDLKGVLRAVHANLTEGFGSEGASTITMQLARQLFLTREKKWTRKIEEAFLAVELEKHYSKQQLLTLYVNLVNLGQGFYGMEAAARGYFNKSSAELTVAEAATLAGIPQRPTHFNVHARPDAVKTRRNWIIQRMHEVGFITEAEMEDSLDDPLLVAPKTRERHLGPYFSEEVRRFLQDEYGTTALYDRGLQVHTTLDRDIQRATESALRDGLLDLDHGKSWRGPKEHLEEADLEDPSLPSWTGQPLIPGDWYEGVVLSSDADGAEVVIDGEVYPLPREGVAWTRKRRVSDVVSRGDVAWFRLEADTEGNEPRLALEQEPEVQGAALVLETSTGAVRGMVGGWDFEINEFNRATQAQRQVGSAFKVFVYGTALEQGFTPAHTLFDGPVVFTGADAKASYSPRNYYRRYEGIITLRSALEKSVNVTAVKLLDMVGVEQVIDFAHRCGVQADLPPYPSLALGAAEMRPIELAAAYGTFANGGMHVEPYFVERVEDREGRVLQEHLPRAHQATSPQVAYLLVQMLRGVVLRGTAAGGLSGISLPMGGKTGTTNDYTDAWFVGFTPRYTILTWVGYDKKRNLGRGMTGARAALPIWQGIVERGLEDGWLHPDESFPRPPGIVDLTIDRDSGLRFAEPSVRPLAEVFVEGTEPDQSFDARWGRVMDLPWYLQEPFYVPKERERMPAQIGADWSAVRAAWGGR